MSDVKRFVAPHLAKATYKGVETLEAIAQEVGLPAEKLIKVILPPIKKTHVSVFSLSHPLSLCVWFEPAQRQ